MRFCFIKFGTNKRKMILTYILLITNRALSAIWHFHWTTHIWNIKELKSLNMFSYCDSSKLYLLSNVPLSINWTWSIQCQCPGCQNNGLIMMFNTHKYDSWNSNILKMYPNVWTNISWHSIVINQNKLILGMTTNFIKDWSLKARPVFAFGKTFLCWYNLLIN